DVFDHSSQQIGAYMRFLAVTNLLWCAVADHLLQNKAASGIADAGGQLAIRKGAGAAFSKLHIGGGVEPALLPEAFHCLHTALHIGAALQNDRTVSHPRQSQSRK